MSVSVFSAKFLLLLGVFLVKPAPRPQNAAGPSAPPATTPPAATPSTLSGCVTPAANNKAVLVLNTGDRCLLLRGDYKAESILNHEVTFKGTLLLPEGLLPARFQVSSTSQVGGSCSRTCTLEPPGTRGVGGNKQKPGPNGGTPGVTDTQPH